MIAGCIALSRRAVRVSLLAVAVAGTAHLAGPDTASAQSPTAEEMLRQLQGRPLPMQAQPPLPAALKGRTRSFTSKEPEADVTQPPVTGPAPVVVHPSTDVEIYFDPASARITRQAEPELNKIGRVLTHESLANARIRIAGHTDGIGGSSYNLELSRRRAEAVRNYLISRFRIGQDRLEAVGFGKEKPKVPEDVASPRNRRVEIVNLSATR